MSSGQNYLINLMPCTNQGHPLSVVRILVFPEVSQMVYGTGSSPYRLWRFCATSERPRRHKTKLVTIIGQLLIYIYIMYIYIHNVNIYMGIYYIHYKWYIHIVIQQQFTTEHRPLWPRATEATEAAEAGAGAAAAKASSPGEVLSGWGMMLWLPSGKLT